MLKVFRFIYKIPFNHFSTSIVRRRNDVKSTSYNFCVNVFTVSCETMQTVHLILLIVFFWDRRYFHYFQVDVDSTSIDVTFWWTPKSDQWRPKCDVALTSSDVACLLGFDDKDKNTTWCEIVFLLIWNFEAREGLAKR